MPELIVIFIVALLVIGPKKLPEFARSLGKGLQEFKRTAEGLRESLKEDLGLDDLKQAAHDALSDEAEKPSKTDAAKADYGGAMKAGDVKTDHDLPKGDLEEKSPPLESAQSQPEEKNPKEPSDAAAKAG